MDQLTRNFAKNLRVIRLSQKLSQEELADRAKLSVAYVSLLERGARTPPLPTIERFAKALKVRPLYLLQELDIDDPPRDLRYATGPARRSR